jgi:bacillithiol biosynthesis deacetylase BshB1
VVDVLAIAAHPDDIEQTCGGALLRMADLGYRTGALDLTAGEMGSRGDPETRLREAQAAASVLGLSYRENLRFPDTQVVTTIDGRKRLAIAIRRLQPRTVILPYWEARHPDHYHTSELGFEASFLAGLRKLDMESAPHRPFKVLYASLYANVLPSFVVDITRYFDKRMESLFCYRSQYGSPAAHSDSFPDIEEIRDRLAGIARFYGNVIGVRYGEPYVVKETMRVDDIVTMPVRSF